MKQKLFWALGLLFWVGTIGAGAGILWVHQNTPAQAAEPDRFWPAASSIERDARRPHLVMLAHPRCPCTRASLEELRTLLSHWPERMAVTVLFYQPEGFSPDWVETDIWRSAQAIPGVSVRRDPDGIEAFRFRSFASGQVLLYDAAGALLFHGGITGSRGHIGDNRGRAAIENLMAAGSAGESATPVFGCPLFDPERARGAGLKGEEGESCER